MSDDYTSNAQGRMMPHQQEALVEHYDRSGAIILITGIILARGILFYPLVNIEPVGTSYQQYWEKKA